MDSTRRQRPAASKASLARDQAALVAGTIPGVRSVRVAMDEAGEMGGAIASANGRLSDADLQTDIAKAYHYDPLLKHDHVKVQVENGVVALRGAVPSLEARHAAQAIAQDFAAAGKVKDLLQVQPVQTS